MFTVCNTGAGPLPWLPTRLGNVPLSAGAISVMLGAGASAVVAAFAAVSEPPFLITMGCSTAFVAGALFAATAEAESLGESSSALTLPG